LNSINYIEQKEILKFLHISKKAFKPEKISFSKNLVEPEETEEE